MHLTPYITKWPTNFEPDDPDLCTLAAIIDEGLEVDAEKQTPLHTHPSGQLLLATEGLVGLELENDYWSVPAHCAIWVPPGVLHTCVLGLSGKTVFFHVGPKYLEGFPNEVIRLMLNSMTVELILFAARGLDKKRSDAARFHLAMLTIEELKAARRMPPQFAPLTNSPALRRIAVEFNNPNCIEWSMSDRAKFVGMSERTLNRQVQRHAGLTFREWRLQHLFLVSIVQLSQGQSVKETAYAAGYCSPSAFIAAFKNIFGLTPAEYRRELLNDAQVSSAKAQ